MTELDPYAVLGVPRSASREEIARAYRRLAKQHHPDAGVPLSQDSMVRLNEAWRILSDAARRARWDRAHTVIQPPAWGPPRAVPLRRPAAAGTAPPSRMDSGWIAAAVIAGVAVLVGVLMIGVSIATQPADDRLRYGDADVSFAYPGDWVLGPGAFNGEPEHRIVAHLVTFGVGAEELCTTFGEECALSGDDIPVGEASIFITAWQGGTPPEPEPVTNRPYGLDADAIIGGKPAEMDTRLVDADTQIAWWQLSPPGFPDRWIEVHAEISGQEPERADMMAEIATMLDTLEFGSGDAP